MSEVKDLSTMIASRVPIIVIESHDEVRVLSLIAEIAMRQGAGVMEWSVVRGLERGAVERGPIPASLRFAPPEEALREMARTAGPVLFAFCDLHPYLPAESLPTLTTLPRGTWSATPIWGGQWDLRHASA